ncbi:GlsB/YeaQ/YmgE family stress response membrane protein [Streptomyces sparsus]
MEISGIITAVVIGALIGVLGRLALPGRQHTGILLTIVVGIVAALIGTVIAAAVGVADTKGIDWIELAIQVALAAGGVAAVERLKGRS